MSRHAPPTRKQLDRVPALHPNGGAEIDAGAIPDGVHEVIACNFEKWKCRVFLVACHGQMLPPPSLFPSLLEEASEFVVQVDGHS